MVTYYQLPEYKFFIAINNGCCTNLTGKKNV